MTRRETLLFGLACLLFAALARLPGLGRSLWYDELFTLVHFTGSLGAAAGEQVGANNHPLASVLTWLARACGAASPGALRAPLWVLGVLAVPALWAQRALIGTRAAGLACAWAVLAPWHVAYAQQLRGYAGLLLAATLLPVLVERAWRANAGTGLHVALAVTAALGCYAHASFVPVVALTAGVAAWGPGVARRDARRAAGWLAGGLAAGGALYAPILARTLKHVRRMVAEGDLGAPGRLGLADLLTVLGDGHVWLGGTLLALACVGGMTLRQRAPRALALLAPPLLVVGLALVCRVPAYPRFALIGLPAALALAGVGWRGLPRPLGAGLAVLILVGSAERVVTRAQQPWQDYAGVGRVLRAQAPDLQPVALRAGSARLLAVVCHPAPAELADDVTLEAWLEAPGLGVVVDDFPALTDPARRALVRARCGPPWVLPGRVSPIAVYWRRPRD